MKVNKNNALQLSKLILDNPNLRVVSWISSDGIDTYIEKDGDMYEDCYAYYGVSSDDWDDETLKQKAKEIPWEEVIAISVSAV